MDEHGDRIAAHLSEGLSYRQIAEQLGCAKDTISAFVKVNFPELRRKPAVAAPKPEPAPMKILVIDIETMANLVWAWGLWDQNIAPSQIVKPARVISFAAKWLGEPITRFYSEFHDGRDEMLQAAWNLINEADAVVHYNGTRFDVPHLNREFWQAKIPPYAPIKQIDLLATVRRRFKFPSNKLEHVSEAIGLEGKIQHEGWRLWEKCDAGDEEAWEFMRDYNVRDVQQTEDLYHEVLGWIDRHPSYGAITSEDVCPNCGSDDLKPHDKPYITTTGTFAQYQCGDCDAFCRDTKRNGKTNITGVAR